MSPKITVEQFENIARERLPFVSQLVYIVDKIETGTAVVRAPYDELFLRPGGTIAGPVLMGLPTTLCKVRY